MHISFKEEYKSYQKNVIFIVDRRISDSNINSLGSACCEWAC